MALSSNLVSQFVKITNDKTDVKQESTVYGTTVEHNGTIYVRIDGSDLLTPISKTADVKADERVVVMIKDHTATVTGNLSSPSARTDDVKEIGNKITEVEVLIADKVSTKEFDAQTGRINELVADNATIKEQLTASRADISDLTAKNATISEKLSVNEADISNLKTEKLDADVAEAKYATIEKLDATDANLYNLTSTYGEFARLTAEKLSANEADISTLKTDKLSAADADLKFATIDKLDAATADIDNLSADLAKLDTAVVGRLDAAEGDIDKLQTEKLSTSEADVKYANIDFSNIGKAAMEYFYANSGLIKDVVIGDGTITGHLVGVTISGDIIEGNTIVAEKLVIKGEDGLYYKLNTNGVTTSTEQTDYNSLNGQVIRAKSVTAEKISVTDLVAFGATIGGFHITNNAIYSGVKESVDNTTTGLYLDSSGQLSFGDGSHYVKYYKDANGNYKLAIVTDELYIASGKKVSTLLDDLDGRMSDAETSIEANSEEIALRAKKTEVAETLKGYYTKAESDAALQVKANEINSTVSSKYATIEDLNNTKLGNLIKNGYGEYLDNTNFNGATFTRGDCPEGCYGYFSGRGVTEEIPFDPTKIYNVSYYRRLHDGSTSGNVYFAVEPLDVDGLTVYSEHLPYYNTNLFYLKQDLKPGDTVAYFEDLTNWRTDTTQSHHRTFLIFGYTDSTGYTYPDGTYSRNVHMDIYSDNSSVNKTDHTITLTNAWSGETVTAGTCIAQSSKGAALCYIGYAGSFTSADWTFVSAQMWAGDGGGSKWETDITARLLYAKTIRVNFYNKVADYAGIYIAEQAVDSQARTDVANLNNTLTTKYSTTVQMNSAIQQKADNITSTVSSTYATKSSVSPLTTFVNNANNNFGYQYKAEILVHGDPHLYYPVYLIGGDQDVMREIMVKRAYSDQCPEEWAGHGTTHGISLTLKLKCNFGGWGGTNYSWRIHDLEEVYGHVFAGVEWNFSHMGFGIFLRGGGDIGAKYTIYSDQKVVNTMSYYHSVTAPFVGLNQERLAWHNGTEENPQYVWYAAAPRTYTDEIAAEIEAAKYVDTVTLNDAVVTMESKIEQKSDSIMLNVKSTYATIKDTASRNLIRNGYGEYLDNTNFPYALSEWNVNTFVREDCPGGSSGYFFYWQTEDEIPYNPDKIYEYEFYRRLRAGKTSGTMDYLCIEPLDVDGLVIKAINVLDYNTNLFYLKQDLKPGDTVAYFEDLTNWRTDTTQSYQRTFLIFGYTDSTGYTYPDGTYSQNVHSDIYSDNSSVDQTNHTITLTNPWSGDTVSAGTCIGQSSDGAVYIYLNSEAVTNTDWVFYSGTFDLSKCSSWGQKRLLYSKKIKLSSRFNGAADYCAIRFAEQAVDTVARNDIAGIDAAAKDTESRVVIAESTIKQLSDSISMLVTDANGTSLMTQTENGWTFSTGDIQAAVNKTSEDLDTLNSQVGDVNNTVDILRQTVDDLGVLSEYVKISTYEDEPCIELGEADSDFKLLITNTRIMFMEGSNVPAYINNQSLYINKAVVTELQQGGFVWKTRSNGNYGLQWIGGTE